MSLDADTQRLLDAVQANKKLSANAIGRLVDQFKVVEAERIAADKVAAALKATEVTLKTAIAVALRRSEVTVVGGKSFRVELTTEDQPTVKDWPAFYAYIKKHDAFELLERRPGKAAVKERWEDGKEVPGVEKFPTDKLSFAKLKG